MEGDHNTKQDTTVTMMPTTTLRMSPCSKAPCRPFGALSGDDCAPFGEDRYRMRRVMMTFWIVRKKFSPYVENGKWFRDA